MGGPALANNVVIVRTLSAFAVGFVPGIGDAYFLASAVAGQDLFTGTSLSQHDRQFYAGMAAFSLLTSVVGPGLFSQEAVAVERTVTELGDVQRLGTQVAHGAEDEARAAETVAQEGRAVEGVARDTGETGAATRDLSDLSAEAAPGASGACSFSADTRVATPHGERPIASLKVGDIVEAYNPQTGKSEAETVQHVWLNHDHDLVDVRVQTTSQTASAAATQTASGTGSRVAGVVQVAAAAASLALTLATGHAMVVPAAVLSPAQAAAQAETIHTTANHPWLTADRGWVQAGDLRAGEAVVTLNGTAGTVSWVHTVAGQADMYNLTVANDHTYAVGEGQYVVHNTDVGPCGGTTPIGPSDARGGVYQLRDPVTGQIGRTGQSIDLYRRMGEHASTYPDLVFEVVYKTDDPKELLALEQMLYEAHPEADVSQGGLNAQAPIAANKAIRFPDWYEQTMRIGAEFLKRYGSGG